MRHIEHLDLFKPPAGTTAIVLPVPGDYHPAPPATYRAELRGAARIAATKWSSLPIVVGVLNWQVGATPHPLTYEKQRENGRSICMPGRYKGLPPSFHIVSFPITRTWGLAPDLDWLDRNARALRSLLEEKTPWLKAGLIVFPPLLLDGVDVSAYVEPYFSDDRYVMISGRRNP